MSRVTGGRSDTTQDRRRPRSNRVGTAPGAVQLWVRTARSLVWLAREDLLAGLEGWVPLQGLVYSALFVSGAFRQDRPVHEAKHKKGIGTKNRDFARSWGVRWL